MGVHAIGSVCKSIHDGVYPVTAFVTGPSGSDTREDDPPREDDFVVVVKDGFMFGVVHRRIYERHHANMLGSVAGWANKPPPSCWDCMDMGGVSECSACGKELDMGRFAARAAVKRGG